MGLVADFGDARPSGAGTWTSRVCYQGAFHVVMSAVFPISPIKRVRHERQGISLGSSARGNKTRYCVVGIPAASQSLNTGTREASVSDAAVDLRRFEALAVSHSLRGKTAFESSSDMAFYETNRELDSQREELYLANQWRDQAQGSKRKD